MRNVISKFADEESETMSFDRGMDAHVLTLSLLPAHSNIGCDSCLSTAHVCANIKASKLPEGEEDNVRAPVDLIVALDVSGSMAGDKLNHCKITLSQLVQIMNPKDRFGLICYESTARVVVPVQSMSDANRVSTLQKIQAMRAGGGTNISASIGLAAQELLSLSNPNPVQSVFLLTDGEANQGICKQDNLVKLTKEILPPSVSLRCFGYGAGHNSELLGRMAESAMGSYYFVENDSSVITAFGDALGGVFSVVAQNITLTFQVPNEAASMGASVIEVMHKDAIRRENGTYTVTLGDLYAEECRDVLVEVSLAKPAHPSHDPIPHIQVLLSYTDTIRKRLVSQVPKQCFISLTEGVQVSTKDTHIEVQLLRLLSVRAIKEAETYARKGQHDRCKAQRQSVRAMVSSTNSACQSDQVVRMIMRQIDEISVGVANEMDFSERGHALFPKATRSFAMQRCAATSATDELDNAFATASTLKFSALMKLRSENSVRKMNGSLGESTVQTVPEV